MDDSVDGYRENCDDHCSLSMLMELSNDCCVKVKAVSIFIKIFKAFAKKCEMKN